MTGYESKKAAAQDKLDSMERAHAVGTNSIWQGAASRYEGGKQMSREDALNMVKLLSAVESWAFSNKTMLPDFLHEDLCVAIKKLETIVLAKDTKNASI